VPGVRHVFGIPGDYVLQFYKDLEESPLELLTTTREDGAGFAADAYARMTGLGVVCVTYCVGGFPLHHRGLRHNLPVMSILTRTRYSGD